jgi:TRAP-type C4-dicarboxylate transport system permease large subunit
LEGSESTAAPADCKKQRRPAGDLPHQRQGFRAARRCMRPVSIILMTAPILLPPLRAANFDIIWFGVVMTIVMEMGLIHPPVGLNIFVIRNVAPDIPLRDVIWGTLPFVLLMMFAVLLLCFVPGISTWLPDVVMGPEAAR